MSRSLIHLLLLGTIIYQFFDGGKQVIVDGIGWRLPLLAVLNAIYVNLWASHYYIIGAFAIFIYDYLLNQWMYHVFQLSSARCSYPQR